MDYTLLEKAMALYEQEQQQQLSTPDCLHDFEYDSSHGEIVCFNCGLIKGPLLIACHAGYFLILVVRDDLNKTCIKLMRVHLVHLIM